MGNLGYMSAHDHAVHLLRAVNTLMLAVAIVTEAVWLCL